MGDRCRTNDVLPTWLGTAYGAICLLFFVSVMVFSYTRTLPRLRAKGLLKKKKGCIGKLALFLRVTWSQKGCYFPLLRHMADQATDLAVIMQFMLLYLTQQRQQDKNERADTDAEKVDVICKKMDMSYFVLLSIFAFFNYRIISAVLIFRMTKSCLRAFMQFLDVEIFRTVWLNYRLGLVRPSNPQRYIETLEAVFESAPQALIQMVFLCQARELGNVVVILSLLFSLYSITARSIKDDRVIFQEEAQELKFKFRKKAMFFKFQFAYVIRAGFRVIDVTVRLFVCTLVWVVAGGLALFLIMMFETCFFALFSWRVRNPTPLMALVLLILHFDQEFKPLFAVAALYRLMTNVLFTAFVTILLFMEGPGLPGSPEFKRRRKLVRATPFMYVVLVYCWIASFMLCGLWVIVMDRYISGNVSPGRSLEEVAKAGDLAGVCEMLEYGAHVDEDRCVAEFVFAAVREYWKRRELEAFNLQEIGSMDSGDLGLEDDEKAAEEVELEDYGNKQQAQKPMTKAEKRKMRKRKAKEMEDQAWKELRHRAVDAAVKDLHQELDPDNPELPTDVHRIQRFFDLQHEHAEKGEYYDFIEKVWATLKELFVDERMYDQQCPHKIEHKRERGAADEDAWGFQGVLSSDDPMNAYFQG